MKDLQEKFLSRLQQEQKPITVVVVNGFQLRGTIIGHDQFTLLIAINGQQQLVYKSAVSTIKEG